MTTQDRLWKMIIEQYFTEFLRYFFPGHYYLMDTPRGFEFLDKELKELFPESEEGNRRCDLLAKVWLKDGSECWILIHIEVQGYRDDEFPHRMYVYSYRGADRFKAKTASLAILTDSDKEWLPKRYEYNLLGTRQLYEYPIYKLALQKEKDFEDSDNMFAIVMQTAMLGMKKRWKGDVLMEVKLNLFRKMLAKGFNQDQIRGLMEFIKYYVRFSDKELVRKFDAEIATITNTKIESEMTVLDTAIELAFETGDKVLIKNELALQWHFEVAIAEEKALEKGIEKGREEGMTKGEITKATKVIAKIDAKYPAWSDKEIADITEMTVSFVKKVRQELKSAKAKPLVKAPRKQGTPKKR